MLENMPAHQINKQKGEEGLRGKARRENEKGKKKTGEEETQRLQLEPDEKIMSYKPIAWIIQQNFFQ